MKFNNTNHILSISFLLLVIWTNDAISQSVNHYQRVYLSGQDAESAVSWDFKVTDGHKKGKWSSIPVPSNWELHGYGNYNYGHDYKNPERKLAKEHGMYRHRFQVPKSWEGKVINIVFDGSMTDTEVLINGKSAGDIHQGGFYRFKYDISELLQYGKENLLEVNVAKHSANASVNRAERQADFWIFGGIFRPVFLEILPPTHISRIAIGATHDGVFKSLVELNKPLSKGQLKVSIVSKEGIEIGVPITKNLTGTDTLTVSRIFENIKAWNPEMPVLYTAKFQLSDNNQVLYEQKVDFGFRTVELRERDGIYLNDKKLVFKGVNRHSFWPETGRALSEKNHLQDIQLIKEMNMNAVRMSHYPPDERFLELCDSIGLLVIDELTGWHDAYDTVVGPKLIKELILKDENHPSVVLWSHGNEGGWDFSSEKWFNHYDLQNRPVIYPWGLRNGVDNRHYPDYKYGINRLANGNNIFMPTEFLHGLYDGGHGAGLDDYWKKFSDNPASAGGFLWSFSDEAVLRTDHNNQLDSDGSHGPDGILGPYREKEGSFNTIKEVWSPIGIKPMVVQANFDGRIILENKYLFTNLNTCNFQWKIIKVTDELNSELINSGSLNGPDVSPDYNGTLQIDIPDNFPEADVFSLTATDQDGMEIYTWTWPIKQPSEITDRLLSEARKSVNSKEISVEKDNGNFSISTSDMVFQFNAENGILEKVLNSSREIQFNGGPKLVGVEDHPARVSYKKDSEGNLRIEIKRKEVPQEINWTVHKSGLLRLEVSPFFLREDNIDYLGISFDYPEDGIESVKWMGQGPYRVWKNRRKGAEIGIWQKDYNNTVTGESFESLIYPEFKGYHGNFYWAVFQNSKQSFKIFTETPGLFIRLFTPAEPKYNPGGVVPPFPEGDISFLFEIPAIGTKFRTVDKLGPSSQKGQTNYRLGDQISPITLWFDFKD
ncbi:glycoside hydrolase family 2 protein [Galbibacter mesophilus]|uniref:glycoside hydrolase family 2 protein n=1 Tax=Galbibacter mesophilus TaxID=379069 RepID=UPI00191EC11D|nr:glycoside hydrolase family 2 TIM barrel-domain containing protein [Galbibacter mesophilus]MCM5661809.1 hypothetical protein [Galbibacter mesophilus]